MALKKFINPYEPAVTSGGEGFEPMDSGFLAELAPAQQEQVKPVEAKGAVEAWLDPEGEYDPTGFALQQGATIKGLAYGKDIFTAPRATGGMQFSNAGPGTLQNVAQASGRQAKLNPYTKLVGMGMDYAIRKGMGKGTTREHGRGDPKSQPKHHGGVHPAYDARTFQGYQAGVQAGTYGGQSAVADAMAAMGLESQGITAMREAATAQATTAGLGPRATGQEATATTNTPASGMSSLSRIGYGALGAGAGMLTTYALDKYTGAGPELSGVAGGVVGGAVAGGASVAAGGAMMAGTSSMATSMAASGIIGGVAAVGVMVGMRLYDKWTGDGRKPPPQVKTEMDVEKRLRTSAMKDWDIREWHDTLLKHGPEAAQRYITGGMKGSGAEYVHDERLPSWLQETLTHGHPDNVTDAYAQAVYDETGVYKGKHQTRFGVRELDGKRVAHELSIKDLTALQNAYLQHASHGGTRKQFSDRYFKDFDLFKEGGADWNEKWHGEELVRLGSEHAGYNPEEYFHEMNQRMGYEWNTDSSSWILEEEDV